MPFPNCFGTADGTHFGIISPKKSVLEFYNNNGFFSIVLVAFVDYDYKFLVAKINSQGRIADAEVLRNSAFNLTLSSNNFEE